MTKLTERLILQLIVMKRTGSFNGVALFHLEMEDAIIGYKWNIPKIINSKSPINEDVVTSIKDITGTEWELDEVHAEMLYNMKIELVLLMIKDIVYEKEHKDGPYRNVVIALYNFIFAWVAHIVALILFPNILIVTLCLILITLVILIRRSGKLGGTNETNRQNN